MPGDGAKRLLARSVPDLQPGLGKITTRATCGRDGFSSLGLASRADFSRT